jgi:flagellar hook-associated protein FlgK
MNTGLLSIARSALVAHQTALQTIAQNVANA